MAEKLANKRKGQAARDGNASKAVAQIVNANVFDARHLSDALPRLCDVDEMSTGTVANYDIRIAFNVGQGDQDLRGE